MSEVHEEPTVECDICGRDGDPPAGCGICFGRATVSPRAYTLSAHRSGRAPKDTDRYGEDGGLNAATSNLVVGGAINHPGLRQN